MALKPTFLRRRQRGAAALALTALLVFALLLVVAWTQRHVVVEARASANGLRAAQAFEAAEAGVEWTLARLNDDAPIGADCRPSVDPADRSFRDSRLRRAGGAAGLVPATWNDAGVERTHAAACVRGAAGWQCSCPTGAPPTVAGDGGGAATPSFQVRLEAGPAASVWRVVSTGCLRADAACAAAADDAHAALARVEVQVALLPALRRSPLAALTAGGDVDVGAAAPRLENRDGVAVRAGGRVVGDAIELVGPAGSPLGDALAAGDAGLAGLDADRFFARWFGIDRAAWRAQPAATEVRCGADCTGEIAAALGAGARLVAVDGDLGLRGPLALGSPARPIVLLATGAARFTGDIVVHGVVHAASLDWSAASAAASLRGALVVHRDVRGNAPATIVHDAAIVAALRREAGSIVRVDASWKDF